MGKRKTKRAPQIVEDVADSDDEEIPEDEAFNSDDERKYGSFFNNKRSGTKSNGSDSSSGDDDEELSEDSDGSDDGLASDDGDSDDGDGGQYMLDLLNQMDSKKNENKDKAQSKGSSIASHTKESEFSSIVPKAGLTLDSLMEGLEDTKGFGMMQKAMKKVAQGQATAAPLARIVTDRANRKVHYKEQTSEVSRWIEAVQENRQAETLDFRPKERLEMTQDVLVEKFVPTTDFEKQIHAALQEKGQHDEEAMLQAEEAALQDDLGANEITLEEYEKRRSQLAKMRALMFYHEQKRHHINKIKSKKYRRIRKKQRLKLKDAEIEAEMEENPDLARELEEKEEVNRMQERMTLAHKNTSKWAKRILKRGKNVDKDTRKALSAQVKRGDDLLMRMNGTRAGDEDDEGSSDEDLVETARKVLADTENDHDEEPVKGKGLFKLSFMQKGIQRQREKAREEARALLAELEANDVGEIEGFDDKVISEPKKQKAKPASKEEMQHILKDGEMVASHLQFGNSDSITVSGGIEIDMEDPKEAPGVKDFAAKSTSNSEHTSTLSKPLQPKAAPPLSSKKGSKPSGTSRSSAPNLTGVCENDANPWLASTPNPAEEVATKDSGKRSAKAANGEPNRTGMVNMDRAVLLLDSKPNGNSAEQNKPLDDAEPSADKKITILTQEELVRRAFASSGEQDAEEFALEKAMVEEQEEENPTRKQKKTRNMATVSGWGSWTGQGAGPPKPLSRRLPKKLQAPEKKLAKRKREDARRPHVIISEKRVKKTASNFMIAQIPHPFSSREQYERSMAGGLGREWNVSSSFKDATRPEVVTRSGKVIQPLSKRVKASRPAAKF